MIHETLNLTVAMYEAIGPGFLLAATLPVFLVALGLLLRAGVKRATGEPGLK